MDPSTGNAPERQPYPPPLPNPPAYSPRPTVVAQGALLSPAGDHVSSVGKRLGQYLLDILLALVTLGIGYIIWSLIIWSKGQTPGMQCLGMRCVRQDTGQTATWGTMFLRQFVGQGIIWGLIGIVTCGIVQFVLMFMLCWDSKRQQLWDKIASTLVVDNY